METSRAEAFRSTVTGVVLTMQACVCREAIQGAARYTDHTQQQVDISLPHRRCTSLFLGSDAEEALHPSKSRRCYYLSTTAAPSFTAQR